MADGNQKHRNTKDDDNDDEDIDDVSSNGSNRATAAMQLIIRLESTGGHAHRSVDRAPWPQAGGATCDDDMQHTTCNKCDGNMQQTTYLDRPPQTSGGLSPATPAERIPVQMAHI
jgi:hypothetical protein